MTWEWLSINMKTIKTRYFPKVSHNGLGPQLSLTMVSGHNHLLRQYLGSIGIYIACSGTRLLRCLVKKSIYIYIHIYIYILRNPHTHPNILKSGLILYSYKPVLVSSWSVFFCARKFIRFLWRAPRDVLMMAGWKSYGKWLHKNDGFPMN